MKWILLGLLAWSCFGQRVVSLSSPETESRYAIGARDLLLGVTGTSVFPEQVMGDCAKGRVKVLGRFADVDRKLLRELKPTLILTGTSFQRRISDELRREGHVVLHSEPAGFADVLAGIRKLGEAVGRARQARRVATEMAAGLDRLQQRTRGLKPVRVYFEMNLEEPWASGRRNPVEDLVRAAGGVNIFGDIDESVFRTSHEQVIERAFGNPIFEPPKQSALHVAVDGYSRHA